MENNINSQQTRLEKSVKKIQSDNWTIKFTLFAIIGLALLIALNLFSE